MRMRMGQCWRLRLAPTPAPPPERGREPTRGAVAPSSACGGVLGRGNRSRAVLYPRPSTRIWEPSPARPAIVPEANPMRMDKLTSRFTAALQDAQSLAVGRDHNFIEPAHLLVALVDQQGGGTRPLLSQA